MSENAQRFGANAVVDTLVAEGVDVFFANPGTSEIHLVAAIDANPKARPVLCLFEGVATGAADGFARAGGKPAAVLLHLGPGLANGLANLHNAFKAGSPMIVLVGEHAAAHLRYDTPLRSDVDSLAGYAAKQVFRMAPGNDLPSIIHAAVQCCRTAPTGPVVVVANADVMWEPSRDSVPAQMAEPAVAQLPHDGRGGEFAKLASSVVEGLRGGPESVLILGATALDVRSLAIADSISQVTGCKLLCETFNARHERGAGIVAVERIPYFREAALDKLQPFASLVLLGSRPPVAFFASPDQRSELTRSDARQIIVPAEVDPFALLGEVASLLGATATPRLSVRAISDPIPGALTPKAIWAVLNRELPAGAIVSDEAGVTSVGADDAMRTAEPHVWLNLTGGSIGQGLPVAAGAAVACPDRTVVALHGDGGAMYTAQALWTQAREKGKVVNIIFRNDRYAILDYEVKRHGLGPLGEKGSGMFKLSDPTIDWVALATGMGVTACAVDTAEDFTARLQDALLRAGPSLLEVRVASGKAKR
jgi:acetolactate synthase-1/2/3 large subunit